MHYKLGKNIIFIFVPKMRVITSICIILLILLSHVSFGQTQDILMLKTIVTETGGLEIFGLEQFMPLQKELDVNTYVW